MGFQDVRQGRSTHMVMRMVIMMREKMIAHNAQRTILFFCFKIGEEQSNCFDTSITSLIVRNFSGRFWNDRDGRACRDHWDSLRDGGGQADQFEKVTRKGTW